MIAKSDPLVSSIPFKALTSLTQSLLQNPMQCANCALVVCLLQVLQLTADLTAYVSRGEWECKFPVEMERA